MSTAEMEKVMSLRTNMITVLVVSIKEATNSGTSMMMEPLEITNLDCASDQENLAKEIALLQFLVTDTTPSSGEELLLTETKAISS